MTTTTAETTETSPAARAERLREEVQEARDRVREKTGEVQELARQIAAARSEAREAALAARAARVRLALLDYAHGLGLDVPDVPETDPAGGDVAEVVDELEKSVEETHADRQARSAETVLGELRQDVRRGDLEEVRRRLRQLRQRLDGEAPGEAAEQQILQRARERAIETARRDLRKRAVRWARSVSAGRAPPALEEFAFPEPVREVLEAFRDSPRDFETPSRWQAGTSHDRAIGPSARDLESAITEATREVGAEELLEPGDGE